MDRSKSPPGESNNLRQDRDSITAANKQRNEYRTKLDNLMGVIIRANSFVQRREQGALCPSERKQHDESLQRLYEHLADVNRHTRALIPLTKQEECTMGYTKTHMVTLFLREDFEEYNRLFVFAEILKNMPDTDSLSSNKPLLTEMKTYVENFGVLYDLVTAETDADPILKDLLETEARSEMESVKKEMEAEEEVKEEDELHEMLKRRARTRPLFNRSTTNPLKRALSILSMIRSPTDPQKGQVPRRQVRSPVMPETIAEEGEEEHSAGPSELAPVNITPQTSNLSPVQNDAKSQEETPQTREDPPIYTYKETTPPPNNSLPRYSTNPGLKTAEPVSFLARFTSNPVGTYSHAESLPKQASRSPLKTKSVEPGSGVNKIIPEDADPSLKTAANTPEEITNMPPNVRFADESMTCFVTNPVKAASSPFSFFQSSAKEVAKTNDKCRLGKTPTTNRQSGQSPTGAHNKSTCTSKTFANEDEEGVILGRTPSPWSDNPPAEETPPLNREMPLIASSADPVKTVDTSRKTSETIQSEHQTSTDVLNSLTASLQSMTDFWKPENADKLPTARDSDDDSYQEPPLFPLLFRSSAVHEKEKKDSQAMSKQTNQHRVKNRLQNTSKTADFAPPRLHHTPVASAVLSTASGHWYKDSVLTNDVTQADQLDSAPNHVKVVISRSTPSGLSSVTSHTSNGSSGISVILGDAKKESKQIKTIWESSVPAYDIEDNSANVSQKQEDPVEVVFRDEDRKIDTETNRTRSADTLVNVVSRWMGRKKENDASNFGTFNAYSEEKQSRNFKKDGIELQQTQPRTSAAAHLVLLGELSMDLLINLIAFRHISQKLSCCDETMMSGETVWVATFVYFALVVVELVMLFYSAWRTGSPNERYYANEGDLESFRDEAGSKNAPGSCTWNILIWTVCANPFVACLLIWALMYEVEKRQTALSLLYLEAVSIVFMYATLYLERKRMSFCSFTAHAIAIVPFFVTCFIVLFYLSRGGVCFYASDGRFWFDGCELCADGWPPDANGQCPGGDAGTPGSYCGTDVNDRFCYFSY